jgi:hypothetical protein
MRIETKRLWFKRVQIFLEDDLDDIDDIIKNNHSIVIISNKKLDLTNWRLREKNTASIDLTDSEEEIFKKFNDTTRNEIRKTYGNTDLSFSSNSDFVDSYGLYCKFEKSQGRKPVNKKEMSHFKVALAFHKGEPIYGLYVIESFPYARIRSIFSKRLSVNDRDMIKVISNSGRRLIWEVCKDLKKNRFDSLDMASVNMENPKTVSISKFKMSFGGKVAREYTYIYKDEIFNLIESAFIFIKYIIKSTFLYKN